MARSRSKRKTTASRQTRATSRKKTAVATADAEIVEDAGGMGMEGGIAVITAVVLFVGCLFLDYQLGAYGGGVFF
jgi:hypothetical protein